MLLRFLRFLRGYVRFEIISPFPERFINITAKNGVRLWDSGKIGGKVFSCMYRGDYLKIRPLARASRARLRVREKHGVPVFIRKYRSRVGLVIGLAVFVLVIQVMSMFIWSVDITGAERLGETQVKSALEKEGLFVGAFKPLLDFSAVSRNVELDLEDIGWMAINVTGSYASVEIKEKSERPEVADTSVPANVKAGADGVIIRMDVREGEAYLKVGSGVVKGQLVVSGVMSDTLGGVRLVRSSADIIALTEHAAVFSAAKKREAFSLSGESVERYRLTFLNAEIPGTFGTVQSDFFAVRSYAESPKILETVMPMSRIRENVKAISTQEKTLDENSAKELLMKESALYETFSLMGCHVVSREYGFFEEDDGYRLEVLYTCEENIAVQEEIGTDENTDRVRRQAETTGENE